LTQSITAAKSLKNLSQVLFLPRGKETSFNCRQYANKKTGKNYEMNKAVPFYILVNLPENNVAGKKTTINIFDKDRDVFS
jgi:hypothetical protein